jgi:hypothetical protein
MKRTTTKAFGALAALALTATGVCVCAEAAAQHKGPGEDADEVEK